MDYRFLLLWSHGEVSSCSLHLNLLGRLWVWEGQQAAIKRNLSLISLYWYKHLDLGEKKTEPIIKQINKTEQGYRAQAHKLYHICAPCGRFCNESHRHWEGSCLILLRSEIKSEFHSRANKVNIVQLQKQFFIKCKLQTLLDFKKMVFVDTHEQQCVW